MFTRVRPFEGLAAGTHHGSRWGEIKGLSEHYRWIK
jgi:hypothetical protein